MPRSQGREADDKTSPRDRFEAIIQPGVTDEPLARVMSMGLDRVPDERGDMRVLVTFEEVVRLLDRGYEVRLRRRLPVQPLDSALVMDDAEAERWMHDQLTGIAREEDS